MEKGKAEGAGMGWWSADAPSIEVRWEGQGGHGWGRPPFISQEEGVD